MQNASPCKAKLNAIAQSAAPVPDTWSAMKSFAWHLPRITTCGLALALSASLALGPATPAMAAPSLEELENAAISASDSYNQAQDALDALNKQIADNETQIADLEAKLPELQKKSAAALRANYKMSQTRTAFLELLLASDDFNQFITTLAYLNDATEANARDIQDLADAKNQLETTQAQLEQQKSELEGRKQAAHDAYQKAQTAIDTAKAEALKNAEKNKAAYEANPKKADQAAQNGTSQSDGQSKTESTSQKDQAKQQNTQDSSNSSKSNSDSKQNSSSQGSGSQSSGSSRPSGDQGGWVAVGASMYGRGDGFMWGTTASGATVTPTSMGVAMKKMPLGTVIEIRYKGHVVRATVNDRGPFHPRREIDLQPAVADALDFTEGVATVEYRVVS